MLRAYENLFSSIKCEGRSIKMPNQHKIIKCLVCEKWMRADNLQKHSQVHKDLLDLPEEEIKEELRIRQSKQHERAMKRQRIVEIAKEEGLTIPEEIAVEVTSDETLDRETLCKEMEDENRRYIAKIELGRMISSILNEKK